MGNLLQGKKGLIFGALNEQSIAWKVAERAVAEGAEIVLTNAPAALRVGGKVQHYRGACRRNKHRGFGEAHR